ncbi:MAG TPA: response regulator transcription factor [Thermoanaerobaculia bacterium]|nr:response regulator transcription factor [Thermoanaerobaculia bacterium]
MPDQCRVALVEDDPRIRTGIRQLIESRDGFRCTGAWASAEDALRGLLRAGADVLLLDIHLPGMQGTDAVPLIHGQWPSMPIVMFTVFEDDERIFTSLCNGAVGYVLKKTAPEKLLDAIADARGGGAPMSPDIARRVVELFRTVRPAAVAPHGLTATEVRLLALLADGHSYQAAADAMDITINTVRNHIRSIYEKLHVHSKSAAVSKAMRARII